MDENDVHYLEKILTNKTNENISSQTFQVIDKKKREIIYELELLNIVAKSLLKN